MLFHETLRNVQVETEFGTINFNAIGETDELTKEQQQKLGNLQDFEFFEEEDVKGEELEDLTKDQLKEDLDLLGIEYSNSDTKKELIALFDQVEEKQEEK